MASSPNTTGNGETKTKTNHVNRSSIIYRYRVEGTMQVNNIHLVIFCVVFTVTQFILAIGGIGLEFKGSWILMAPFSLWFLNWFLLMFAVFRAQRTKNLAGVLVFTTAIFIHYALTISEVLSEINRFRISPAEEEGLGRVLALYPSVLVHAALTYLLGNLFVWGLFIWGLLPKRNSLR